jgi:hypothetical protein
MFASLLDIYETEARKRRLRSPIALTLVYICVMSFLSGRMLEDPAYPFAALTLSLFAAYLGTLRRVEIQAANALTEYDDVRVLGPLVETLAGPRLRAGWTDYRGIVGALTRLLPRLRTFEEAGLTGERRQMLYRQLERSADPRRNPPELTAALLKALGEVGDTRALPQVTRLADGKPRPEEGRRVQTAARECLFRLKG